MASSSYWGQHHHCPPPSPSSFALFPELPFELRLRIWAFCSPAPRTVQLTTSIKGRRLLFSELQRHRKPSVLLSTCWESRCFYLANYSKLVLDGSPTDSIFTYVNPRLDILHFDKKSFIYLLWLVSVLGDCVIAKKEALQAVRRVETDVDTIDEIIREQAVKDVIGPLLSQFSGLHEICFVLRKGSFYRRYREMEGPRFFASSEEIVFADAGKAALSLIEESFGSYKTTHPDVRIPNFRVKVHLPGFLV